MVVRFTFASTCHQCALSYERHVHPCACIAMCVLRYEHKKVYWLSVSCQCGISSGACFAPSKADTHIAHTLSASAKHGLCTRLRSNKRAQCWFVPRCQDLMWTGILRRCNAHTHTGNLRKNLTQAYFGLVARVC